MELVSPCGEVAEVVDGEKLDLKETVGGALGTSIGTSGAGQVSLSIPGMLVSGLPSIGLKSHSGEDGPAGQMGDTSYAEHQYVQRGEQSRADPT